MKRTLGRIILGIAVLVVLAATFFSYTPSNESDESYAVYSSFLEQDRTGDSHALGDPQGLVLILDHTSTGMFRILVPRFEIAYPASSKLDMALRNLFSRRLSRQFHLRGSYLLIPSTDTSTLTEAQLRSSYGVMRFSKVTFRNQDTEAFFYQEHLCGMCGYGSFVHMAKENGTWRVIDQDSTWIS